MEIFIVKAERIYKSFYDRNKFSSDSTVWLNLLLKEIKKEIADTDLEIKFKNIYFKQGFKSDFNEGFLHLDISLIPSYENKFEFILWLAGFIERITTGGKRNPPSIRINIPTEYTYVNSFSTNSRKENDRKREKLMNGFKTEDFFGNYKKEK
ncbi:hypothetical protein [Acinetobacter modestus]|uniref:hypothetical protein n=1 Tax=Acinetobacter modestus TaxID=1776740 RepID=UPI0030185A3B